MCHNLFGGKELEKLAHNLIFGYQWGLFLAGAIAAIPLGLYFGIPEALLSLVVSLLALVALKLEVLAFAR